MSNSLERLIERAEHLLNRIEGISMHYELVLTHEDGNDAIHLDGINIMGRERDE